MAGIPIRKVKRSLQRKTKRWESRKAKRSYQRNTRSLQWKDKCKISFTVTTLTCTSWDTGDARTLTASQEGNSLSRFENFLFFPKLSFHMWNSHVVSQAARGLRRQFLMTNNSNIIVLLEKGKKVTSCNNTLNDVTERVKCKVSSAWKVMTLLLFPFSFLF